MTDKYKRVYAALKAYGFSPPKALEVLFDAKRNNRLALHIVSQARKGN